MFVLSYRDAIAFLDYVKSCDLMWKQSVWTSVFASQIAAKHLNRCILVYLLHVACAKHTRTQLYRPLCIATGAL